MLKNSSIVTWIVSPFMPHKRIVHYYNKDQTLQNEMFAKMYNKFRRHFIRKKEQIPYSSHSFAVSSESLEKWNTQKQNAVFAKNYNKFRKHFE